MAVEDKPDQKPEDDGMADWAEALQEQKSTTDKPEVEPKVTLHDGGERLRDDRLQLMVIEAVERTAREHDGGIRPCETYGESIDVRLVLKHDDLRHREARCDRRGFNQLAQAPQSVLVGVGGHRAATEREGEGRTAATQPQPSMHVRADDRHHGGQGGQGNKGAEPVEPCPGRQHHTKQDEVARHHQRKQGQHEPQDEVPGTATDGLLPCKQVHGSGHRARKAPRNMTHRWRLLEECGGPLKR